MRTIRLADVTLRVSGAKGENSLSFKQKLEIARELDRLGADVIETAPLLDAKTDALLVRTIASLVTEGTLACPALRTEESVAEVWEALKGAKKPRIVVPLPVSTVRMEYEFSLKSSAMLERITSLVASAKALCPEVEFAAGDATRAEFGFLTQAIGAAIAAGATVVTVCDDAGTMLPDEFAALLVQLREAVPALSGVTLGAQCSDALRMGAACAVAALGAGADEVKTAVSGDTTPALDALGAVLRARGDSLGLSALLDQTRLGRAVERMRGMTDTRRTATSAFDNRMGERAPEDVASLALEKDTPPAELEAVLHRLGYELSAEDAAQVYEQFRRIAEKKSVGAKELDAIVAAAALQVPPKYKLISYVINSGNIINATAHVRMEKDGELLTGLVTGDGPIDAAFLALEQIVGTHYELDDFQIQAVTEGREAMGSALVKLRARGRLYSGQGVSTDVIGASIRAWVDALNKIAYEEEQT